MQIACYYFICRPFFLHHLCLFYFRQHSTFLCLYLWSCKYTMYSFSARVEIILSVSTEKRTPKSCYIFIMNWKDPNTYCTCDFELFTQDYQINLCLHTMQKTRGTDISLCFRYDMACVVAVFHYIFFKNCILSSLCTRMFQNPSRSWCRTRTQS